MPKFRVTLVKVEPQSAITHDGYPGKLATFRIEGGLGMSYEYVGRSGGKAFEDNCARMQQSQPITVEADYPLTGEPDTEWKERIIHLALLPV